MKITKEKIILICVAVAIVFFVWGVIMTLFFSDFSNDRYRLVLYELSSDKKRVGVMVSNTGGGAVGYCRDLVYDFPNINDWGIPDLHFEKDNEEYLVSEEDCGEVKSIKWVNGEVKIN